MHIYIVIVIVIGRYSHPEIHYVEIKYLDFQIIDNNRRKIRINFSTNFLLESTYIANTEKKKALPQKADGSPLTLSLRPFLPTGTQSGISSCSYLEY